MFSLAVILLIASTILAILSGISLDVFVHAVVCVLSPIVIAILYAIRDEYYIFE
jgi:hypothetical protein